jgi:hypothetical protein
VNTETAMPIKPENRALYPADWNVISLAAKQRARWRCVQPGCNARQYSAGVWYGDRWQEMWRELWSDETGPAAGTYATARQRAADLQWGLTGDDPEAAEKVIVIVLTTAHLDHDPANCEQQNLAPMCQRHHLAYDHQHHQANAYMTRRERANTLELPLSAGKE